MLISITLLSAYGLCIMVCIRLSMSKDDKVDEAPVSVKLKIVNHADHPINLYWIKRKKGKIIDYIKQSKNPIRNSTNTKINSFDGHQFMINYTNPKYSGNVTFTKGSCDETVRVHLHDITKEMVAIPRSKHQELSDKIYQPHDQCMNHHNITDYQSCIIEYVTHDMMDMMIYKEKKVKQLTSISNSLSAYTCHDPLLNYSIPKSHLNISIDDRLYEVDEYFNITNVKIWNIDNFVSQEECDMMTRYGSINYKRYRDYDDNGMIVYPVSHHAHAARFASKAKAEQSLSVELLLRMIAAIDSLAAADLPINGQQQFTIFKYGRDDYHEMHCDGCIGRRYQRGDIIATVSVYCQVAEKGGATVFPQSSIYLKPNASSALIVLTRGTNDMIDDGYASRAECPVLEGEKVMVSSWIRDGVSQHDPWTKFDPLNPNLL